MNQDPIIGKKLGDYEIIELLGHGGMARVYRGYDDKLDRYAAVKIIHADVTVADLEEYQARFAREARAIARLQHPNIVGVYQFGQAESKNFMAMQFIDGQDLRYLIQEHNVRQQLVPEEEILNIARDIAAALDYAHTEGVIHRDIKPSNIMVTPDGRAILTDFGLALSVPEGTIGNTFGSAHYIAPEQAISSAHAMPQSDLYSLGVVLYEMLAGKVPFDDPSAMSVALQHLNDPPPLPRLYNPKINPAVEKVLMRALDKEPGRRYPTGIALVTALETAMGLLPDDTTKELPRLDTYQQARTAETEAADEIFVQLVNQNTPTPKPAVPVPGPANTRLLPETPAQNITTPGLPAAPAPPGPAANAGQPARRSLPIPLILLGAAVLVIAILIVVLASSGDTIAKTPTPSPQALAGQPTQAPGDDPEGTGGTNSPTQTPRPTDTRVPSETPDSPEPTRTAAPTEAAVAAQPTATNTLEPTATTPPASDTPTLPPASPTFTPSDAEVLLLYNTRELLLINQSDRFINVQTLLFRRVDPEAAEPIQFPAADWSGGTDAPSALPPGHCFQIWRDDLGIVSPNDMPYNADLCEVRAAFRIGSVMRWFWIAENSSNSFDVIQFNQVLTNCVIQAGWCEVDIVN